MKEIKEISGIGLIVILGLMILGFIIYGFIGFTSWLFTDPFNWVKIEPPQQSIDVQSCIDKGGVPIVNSWVSKLDRCEFKK